MNILKKVIYKACKLKTIKMNKLSHFILNIQPKLFDKDWYCKRYPFVLEQKLEPILYHLSIGEQNNLDPHPWFSTRYYRKKYMSEIPKSQSPLYYFLSIGIYKNHSPHPWFDSEWYLTTYSYPKENNIPAYSHFDYHNSINEPLKANFFYHERHNSILRNYTNCKSLETPDWIQERGVTFDEIINTQKNILCYCHHTVKAESLASLSNKYNFTIRALEQSRDYHFAKLAVYHASNKIEFFENFTFQPLKPYIAELKNIFIVSNSHLILFQEGELALDGFTVQNKSRVKNNGISEVNYRIEENNDVYIDIILKKYKIKQIENAIILTHIGDWNYYHFIVEALSRLLLVSNTPKYANYPILLSNNLAQTMIEYVKLIAPNHKILYAPLGLTRFVNIKNAVYPSEVSRSYTIYGHDPNNTNYPHDNIDLAKIKIVTQRVLSHYKIESIPPFRKLLIKRTSQKRKLTNFDEIAEMLSNRGYEIFEPALHNLEEQVRYFHEAKEIVIPTGAEATNIIYCQINTKITILFSRDNTKRVSRIWVALAAIHNLNINYVLCSEENNDTHDDYSINLNVLSNAIDRQQE